MPLTYQKSQSWKEAESKVKELTVTANTLTTENEILKQENEEKDEIIANITASERTKHEEIIAADYLKKDDQVGIILAAKELKMITEEEAKSLQAESKNNRKLAAGWKKKFEAHECPENGALPANLPRDWKERLAELAQLKTNYSQLESESLGLKEQNQQLTEKMNLIHSQNEQLKLDNDQLATDTSNLKNQLAQNQVELAELRSQLEQKSQPLADNSQQDQISLLEKEIADLQAKIQALESELENLQAKLAEWNKYFSQQTPREVSDENVLHYGKFKDFEARNIQYQADIERMKGQVKRYYQDYKTFRDLATDKKLENDRLTKEVRELKAQIEVLTN